jgi:hypothetical protein
VLDRPQSPFFRARVRGVNEGLGEIEFPAVAQIRSEPLEQPIQAAAALPLLKPPMAGLVRRVTRREIGPRRAGAQHPQHAVEYGAGIGPGAAASIRPPTRPEGRFENGPLRVGQIHAARYDAPRLVVTRRVTDL